MNKRPTLKLNFAKRAGLAIAGILAVAIPLIIGITNAPALRAQAQSDLRFEVVSVRRVNISPTDKGVPVFGATGGIGTSDPRRITYRGEWLANLITQAFGVRHDQITGPEWLTGARAERYDIVALIPEGATKEQFNIMLGNLLRDRFHLRFHIDSKTVPVYALRVAKNGPKFKETTVGQREKGTAPTVGLDAQGFPVMPPDRHGMVGFPANGEMRWTAQDVPMADFARSLEQNAQRPVIDETGLIGHYDFKIHYEWRRPTATGVTPDPVPSVFDAVEQQLGLKLESATKSFPQFIIDSIDREPTEN